MRLTGHARRRSFGWGALVAFVAAAIVATIHWTGRTEPPIVTVGVIDTGPVRATVANTRAGTVKACLRSGLSPAIGGQIATLSVHEGDHVEPGLLLMTLRPAKLITSATTARLALRLSSEDTP